MTVRTLTEADTEIFRAVRPRALREEPEAFGSSYEEYLGRPLESVAQRLRDTVTLGVFIDGSLAGTITFQQEQGTKERHKGTITAMYVAPEMRRMGLGKELLREVITRARELPGLEQVNLAVVTANVPARNLYRSFGFEVYGLERRALKLGDRYLDEELMVLWLHRP